MFLLLLLRGGCLVLPGGCSWIDDFIQQYRSRGAVELSDLDVEWARRTAEYGIVRPAMISRIFVYRAYDLWSNVGPFSRATTAVYATIYPDELLTRIALYWRSGNRVESC